MKLINVISIGAIAVVCVLSFTSLEVVNGQANFLDKIATINKEVDKWYKKETNIARSIKAAAGMTSGAHRQSTANHWPRHMMSVLQMAIKQHPSNSIDMAKVFRIVGGLKHEIVTVQQEFVANFGQYLATKFKFKDSTEDLGVYYRQVRDLCTPFRPDSKGYFNFHGAIKDLIQLKKIENVDDKKFIDLVVLTKEPIAALYSAALICQVIDSITGSIDEKTREFKLELPGSSKDEIGDWTYVAQ